MPGDIWGELEGEAPPAAPAGPPPQEAPPAATGAPPAGPAPTGDVWDTLLPNEPQRPAELDPAQAYEALHRDAFPRLVAAGAISDWKRADTIPEEEDQAERSAISKSLLEPGLEIQAWLAIPRHRRDAIVAKLVASDDRFADRAPALAKHWDEQGPPTLAALTKAYRGEKLSDGEKKTLRENLNSYSMNGWKSFFTYDWQRAAEAADIAGTQAEVDKRGGSLLGIPISGELAARGSTLADLAGAPHKGLSGGYFDPAKIGAWLGNKAGTALTGIRGDSADVTPWTSAAALAWMDPTERFMWTSATSAGHLAGALVPIGRLAQGSSYALRGLSLGPKAAARLGSMISLGLYNSLSMPEETEGDGGYGQRLVSSFSTAKGLAGRGIAGAEGLAFGALAPAAASAARRFLQSTPPGMREAVAEMLAWQVTGILVSSGKASLTSGELKLEGVTLEELAGSGLLGAMMGFHGANRMPGERYVAGRDPLTGKPTNVLEFGPGGASKRGLAEAAATAAEGYPQRALEAGLLKPREGGGYEVAPFQSLDAYKTWRAQREAEGAYLRHTLPAAERLGQEQGLAPGTAWMEAGQNRGLETEFRRDLRQRYGTGIDQATGKPYAPKGWDELVTQVTEATKAAGGTQEQADDAVGMWRRTVGLYEHYLGKKAPDIIGRWLGEISAGAEDGAPLAGRLHQVATQAETGMPAGLGTVIPIEGRATLGDVAPERPKRSAMPAWIREDLPTLMETQEGKKPQKYRLNPVGTVRLALVEDRRTWLLRGGGAEELKARGLRYQDLDTTEWTGARRKAEPEKFAKVVDYLATKVAQDADFQRAAQFTGQHFYDVRMRTLRRNAELVDPTFKDEHNWARFRLLLALTSYANEPGANLSAAFRAWAASDRKPGMAPDAIAPRQPDSWVDKSGQGGKYWTTRPVTMDGIELVNHLWKQMGPEEFLKFVDSPHAVDVVAQVKTKGSLHVKTSRWNDLLKDPRLTPELRDEIAAGVGQPHPPAYYAALAAKAGNPKVEGSLAQRILKAPRVTGVEVGQPKAGAGVLDALAGDTVYGSWIVGPKGGPFMQNLRSHEAGHSVLDLQGMRTIERHTGRVRSSREEGGRMRFDPNEDAGPTAQDRALWDQVVGKAASTLGLEPRQAQALIWRYEQTLWHAHGGERAVWDYANAVQRMMLEGLPLRPPTGLPPGVDPLAAGWAVRPDPTRKFFTDTDVDVPTGDRQAYEDWARSPLGPMYEGGGTVGDVKAREYWAQEFIARRRAYQAEDAGTVRGWTDYLKTDAAPRASIVFTRNADPSTVVHELTHAFTFALPVSELGPIARDAGVSGEFRNPANWSIPQLERVAQGVERFLFEGAWPLDPDALPAYTRLYDAMRKVYAGPPGEALAPATREAFDRAFGTKSFGETGEPAPLGAKLGEAAVRAYQREVADPDGKKRTIPTFREWVEKQVNVDLLRTEASQKAPNKNPKWIAQKSALAEIRDFLEAGGTDGGLRLKVNNGAAVRIRDLDVEPSPFKVGDRVRLYGETSRAFVDYVVPERTPKDLPGDQIPGGSPLRAPTLFARSDALRDVMRHMLLETEAMQRHVQPAIRVRDLFPEGSFLREAFEGILDNMIVPASNVGKANGVYQLGEQLVRVNAETTYGSLTALPTIIHELTHRLQYAIGGKQFFRGDRIPEAPHGFRSNTYVSSPWEQEAFSTAGAVRRAYAETHLPADHPVLRRSAKPIERMTIDEFIDEQARKGNLEVNRNQGGGTSDDPISWGAYAVLTTWWHAVGTRINRLSADVLQEAAIAGRDLERSEADKEAYGRLEDAEPQVARDWKAFGLAVHNDPFGGRPDDVLKRDFDARMINAKERVISEVREWNERNADKLAGQTRLFQGRVGDPEDIRVPDRILVSSATKEDGSGSTPDKAELAWRSRRHAEGARAIDEVLTRDFKLAGKVTSAIGDTKEWGAEDSYRVDVADAAGPDLLRAAARLGRDLGQDGVVAFAFDRAGQHKLYEVSLSTARFKNASDVARVADEVGLEIRTVTKDGDSWRVSTVDKDGSARAPAQALGERYGNAPFAEFTGTATFLGRTAGDWAEVAYDAVDPAGAKAERRYRPDRAAAPEAAFPELRGSRWGLSYEATVEKLAEVNAELQTVADDLNAGKPNGRWAEVARKSDSLWEDQLEMEDFGAKFGILRGEGKGEESTVPFLRVLQKKDEQARGAGARARQAYEALDASVDPAPDWSGRRIGVNRVLEALEAAADKRFLTGRTGPGNVVNTVGAKEVGAGAVRLRHAGSLVGALHAVGWTRFPDVVKEARAAGTWGRVGGRLIELGREMYEDTVPAGGFARAGMGKLLELVARGTTTPADVEAVNVLRKTIAADPVLAKRMDEALSAFRDYVKQGDLARADQNIVDSGKPGARQRLRGWLRRDLAREWMDDKIDIYRFSREAEALLGRKLEGFDSPELISRAFTGLSVGRGADAFQHGIPDPRFPFNYEARSSPGITDDVMPLLRKHGRREGPRKFAVYLIARRAQERWQAKADQVGQLTDAQLLQLHAAGPAGGQALLQTWFGTGDYTVRETAGQAIVFNRGKDPGMSPADADSLVGRLQNPEFELAAAHVYKWGRALLRYRAAMGAMTPDEVRAAIQESGSYVPLRRVMEDLSPGVLAAELRSGGDPFRSMTGSWRRVRNPLITMAEYAAQSFKEIETRVLANSMLKLARQAPELSAWIHEVPPEQARALFDLSKIRTQLEKLGIDTTGVNDHEVLTLWTTNSRANPEQSVYPVIDPAGKRTLVYVEPGLYQALTGHGTHVEHGALWGVMRTLTSLFKTGTTGLSPKFAYWRNPARDLRAFAVQDQRLAGEGRVAAVGHRVGSYVVTMFSALRELMPLVPTGEWHRLARSMGLDASVVLGEDRPATRRFVRAQFPKADLSHPMQAIADRVLRNPADALDWLREKLQSTEIAPRAASMRRYLLGEGVTDPKTLQGPAGWSTALEAIRRFREVTVDFQKGGTRARDWNQIIPFFNVKIQGPRATLRAFQRDPSGAIVASLLTATVPSLINWWRNKDEDWWKRMRWSEKFLGDYVRVGDELVGIPFTQEVSTLASVPLLMGLEYAYQKDPRAVKAGVGQIFDGWDPSGAVAGLWDATGGFGMDEPDPIGAVGKLPIPHPIRPLVEAVTNVKSYPTGQPIDSQGELDQDARYRASEHTTALASWIGDKLNLSPKRIDHVIGGIFGSVGRDVLQASPLGGAAARAEQEGEPIPFGIGYPGGTAGVRDQMTDDLFTLNQRLARRLNNPGAPEEGTPERDQLLAKRLILTVAQEDVAALGEKLKPGVTYSRAARNAIRAEQRAVVRRAMADVENAELWVDEWKKLRSDRKKLRALEGGGVGR